MILTFFRAETFQSVTGRWAWRPGNWIPAGKTYFWFLQTDQTVSGASPASCSMGHWVHFRGLDGQPIKLNAHLQLVPRLRISRATPPLPLYGCMTWTRSGLPLPLPHLC